MNKKRNLILTILIAALLIAALLIGLLVWRLTPRSLESLTGLVNLNFANNQVKTIPSFPADCALVTIDGSNNLVESLKPLQGLHSLNNIYMDYNTEISTLKWLAENSTLVLVNVYGTKVNSLDQVADLTEHDIIVNFTPIQED